MFQLYVFDLDNCVWHPEMYQIQGPPMLSNLQSMKDGRMAKTPRKRKRNNQGRQRNPLFGTTTSSALPKKPTTNRKGMIVTDRAGTPITVFEGASYALSELNRWKRNGNGNGNGNYAATSEAAGSQIQIAVASCTDKPTFARQCMEWLIIDDGSTLSSTFDHIEIRPGDKKRHFESLHRITNIPYEDMCFFDDYMLNIDSVSTLGVTCIHTPHGMTKDAWDEALSMLDGWN